MFSTVTVRRVASAAVAIAVGAAVSGVPGPTRANAQSSQGTVLITVIPPLPPPPGSPSTLPPAVRVGDQLVIPLAVPTTLPPPSTAAPATTAVRQPVASAAPLKVAPTPVKAKAKPKTKTKAKSTKTKAKRVCIARNKKGVCTKYR